MSCPASSNGLQLFHSFSFTNSAASTIRRAVAIKRANAKSAVVSVNTSGVLQTAIPFLEAVSRDRRHVPGRWSWDEARARGPRQTGCRRAPIGAASQASARRGSRVAGVLSRIRQWSPRAAHAVRRRAGALPATASLRYPQGSGWGAGKQYLKPAGTMLARSARAPQ